MIKDILYKEFLIFNLYKCFYINHLKKGDNLIFLMNFNKFINKIGIK